MDLATQFQQAEQYFFDGKLQECASLCQQMLNTNPNFAHGYYLMGALFKTTGNFVKAVQFSDLAIKHAPNVAAFYLQRGHSQFILNDVEAARQSLEQACALDKSSAVSFLLLADCYVQQKQFDKAIGLFEAAKKIDDLPEIEEHLGLCLQMKGDLDGAEQTFKRVIARRPDYDWGYIHLGKVQWEKKDVKAAEENLTKALALNSFAYEAMLALAQIHKIRGDLDGAAHLALNASHVSPQLINPYLVLGEIYYLSSKLPESEQMYRKALEIDETNLYALQGLATTLVNLRKTEEAIGYLDKVLARKPDEVTAKYLRAAIAGENVATAPAEYVSRLFDDYADRFDTHLTHSLDYNTPEALSSLVREVLAADAVKLSLLDLGCGTGLAAEAFADITTRRVGVDLSAKMIDKAVAKKLYDETHVQDIVAFAAHTQARFNLVVAADVLVYMGDLEALFTAAHKVLERSGLFAFSVENGDATPPFALGVSARYAHAAGYVRAVAEQQGFVIVKQQLATLRKDRNQPIEGYLFVLQKPALN